MRPDELKATVQAEIVYRQAEIDSGQFNDDADEQRALGNLNALRWMLGLIDRQDQPDWVTRLQGDSIVHARLASDEASSLVANANRGTSDGRSPWVWLHIRDATHGNDSVMLACFPQGDTYEATELDHSG